jgi:hypothetical protein
MYHTLWVEITSKRAFLFITRFVFKHLHYHIKIVAQNSSEQHFLCGESFLLGRSSIRGAFSWTYHIYL